MDHVTTKKVDEDIAFYTLRWSPLQKVDKYHINNSVPAMAGIYELYYMDDKKRLNLFYFAWVWYGGLRHTLRQITDPDLNLTHPKRRQVLEERECFYRYTLIESQGDMEDVLHFLAFQKVASPEVPAHSGRYEDILLDEISPDKVFDSN